MRHAGELPRQPPLELQALGRLVAAGALAAAALAAALIAPPAAHAQPSPDASEPLRLAPARDVAPPGRRLAARAVIRLAERRPAIRSVRAERPRSYLRAYLQGRHRWVVRVLATRAGPDEEIGQVVVDDRSGRVLETWTGVQVAWPMARGVPGAFGRKVNEPYVWLTLLALFLLPFLRPPLRLVHLDIAAVASLSASYAAFNRAQIELAVPLAYPPLVYLLIRSLLIARARARGGEAREPPLPLLLGPAALGFLALFLVGFRIALNLTASNVIDVGYAGVIGADALADGRPLYGAFPEDNRHGDTYGPVTYLAYVPFEQALPWSGTWDDLPAAHAAALAFDLLTAAGLWLLGRRLRGPRLGVLLAYLWLACPFTILVANANANDSLVAALVVGCLLVGGRPLARGAVLGAAALTKFAPLALVPLIATHRPGGAGAAARTFAGLAVAVAVALVPVVAAGGDPATVVERTVGYQLGRESPFSVWGLWELGGAQRFVQAAVVALAVAVAVLPRRRDDVALAALVAAVLIATQLAATHWFHLYVVWFLPPLLVAVLAGHGDLPSAPGAGSARSRRPAAAADSG